MACNSAKFNCIIFLTRISPHLGNQSWKPSDRILLEISGAYLPSCLQNMQTDTKTATHSLVSLNSQGLLCCAHVLKMPRCGVDLNAFYCLQINCKWWGGLKKLVTLRR